MEKGEYKPSINEVGWPEDVVRSRPYVILEGYSGSPLGLITRENKGWFSNEGQYSNARYLSVDPFPSGVMPYEWGYFVKDNLEKVAKDKELMADVEEVWIKNAGSLEEKKQIWDQVIENLKSGARIVFYDDYTASLPEELDRLGEIFGPDVDIDDFTGHLDKSRIPMLEDQYNKSHKDSAVGIVITKR